MKIGTTLCQHGTPTDQACVLCNINKKCPECNREMDALTKSKPHRWYCGYCETQWTPVTGIRGVDLLGKNQSGQA